MLFFLILFDPVAEKMPNNNQTAATFVAAGLFVEYPRYFLITALLDRGAGSLYTVGM